MFTNTLPSKRRVTNITKPTKQKRRYVYNRLRELGLDFIELSRSEANYLPSVLHDDEFIGGVIVGRSEPGHIMIVATDKRVIVLDCKLMFNNAEDVSYVVVAGVTVSNVGLLHRVTLHTRLGDFKVLTIYAKASRLFRDYIDQRCLEHPEGGTYYDQAPQAR